MKTKYIIRLILWSGLGLVVLFLIWQVVVPFGRITYRVDFGDYSYFIPKLTPAERVEPGDGSVKLAGDPVYYSLRAPRRFNTAVITFTYRTKGEVPVIESGVLKDKELWRYDLAPVQNAVIDRLAGEWDAVREGGVTLWQREKAYDTLAGFLASPPPASQTAVYNYNWQPEYILPGYSATSEETVIEQDLRGAYQFYTYIKDEALDFRFALADLNQNRDADPVEAILYYQDEFLDSKRIEDQGGETGEVKELPELALKATGLPEGAYKVELRASSDIITKSIKTRQNKLSFINKIRLARGNGSPPELYTDSHKLQFVTTDPESLQTITVGSTNVELADTYQQVVYSPGKSSSTRPVKQIILETGGLTISGGGIIAFSRNHMINPMINRAISGFDPDQAGVGYILAAYESPARAGEWQKAAARIDLTGAYRENGAYAMIISIPGLRADDDIEDWVEIREIVVELEGKGVGEKVKEIFNL